jgi:uncharacterized protein DUF4339
MQTPIWFLTNGTWRLGPLTLDQALGALRQAAQPVDVYVWRDGMEGWLRPEAVPEIAAGLQGAPAPAPFPPPPVQSAGWSPAVAAATAATAEPPRPAPWFVVGPVKLAVMSIVTLGLYQVFWFYRHWKQARDVQHDDVWPIPRAIFGVIFAYPLFSELADTAAVRGHAHVPNAIFSTILFVALTVAQRLPDPWWLVTFFSVVPLLPIQRAANAIALEDAPGTDPNTRFTGLNWVGIVVGGLFLLLALIGTLIPEEAEAAVSLARAAVRPA